MFSTETFLKFYNKFNHLLNFYLYLRYSTRILIIMSSPRQKRGTCGHIMAVFDGHFKCARCRDKGVGDDPCVLKKDCSICKAFTPDQLQQLATPTYRDRKNRDKKTVSASWTLHKSTCWVEKTVKKPETTPSGKKKRSDESPKASRRKSSSKPSTEESKQVGKRFARLEAMILAKSFAVPVEPVVKSTEVITSEKPFDPGAGTSQISSGGVSDVSFTGPSLLQATGEVAAMKATQPVEAPSTRRGDVIQKNECRDDHPAC